MWRGYKIIYPIFIDDSQSFLILLSCQFKSMRHWPFSQYDLDHSPRLFWFFSQYLRYEILASIIAELFIVILNKVPTVKAPRIISNGQSPPFFSILVHGAPCMICGTFYLQILPPLQKGAFLFCKSYSSYQWQLWIVTIKKYGTTTNPTDN